MSNRFPSRKQTLTGQAAPITCVAFDANEEYVAAGASDGQLRIWDLQEEKGKMFANIELHPFVTLIFHNSRSFDRCARHCYGCAACTRATASRSNWRSG